MTSPAKAEPGTPSRVACSDLLGGDSFKCPPCVLHNLSPDWTRQPGANRALTLWQSVNSGLVKLVKLCKRRPLAIAERGISSGMLRIVKVIKPHANQLRCNVYVGH